MLPWIDAQENGSEDVMWIQIWGFRRSIRIMTESIWRYSGSGNIFFFFSFFCLVPSLLYPAFIIGPHRYPMAGGGHGGQAVAPPPPPKKNRKSIVLVLMPFLCSASFIGADWFPKAGGGHGGEGAAPPPQRTQEEQRSGFDPFRFASFPLCLVIVVLVVVLPSSSCSCVWCRLSCIVP